MRDKPTPRRRGNAPAAAFVTVAALGAAWGSGALAQAPPEPEPSPPSSAPLRDAEDAELAPVAPSADSPLLFDPDSFDFGEMEEGEEPSSVFLLKNRGAAALTVSRVYAPCGCTAAVLDAGAIPPGGGARLRLTFRSLGHVGEQRTRVLVYAADPGTAAAALSLHAKVLPVFVVDPPVIDFGEFPRGAELSRDVEIRDRKGRPFVVRNIVSGHSSIRASTPVDGREEAGPVHRFRLTLLPGIPPGPLTSLVEIRTDRAQVYQPRLVVQGSVEGAVRVRPGALFLGQIHEGETFPPGELRVEAVGPGAVDLEKVDAGDAAVRAVVTTTKPGREYRIAITVEPPPPPGRFQRVLRIATSEPGPPTEVTLSGMVLRKGEKPGAEAAPVVPASR